MLKTSPVSGAWIGRGSVSTEDGIADTPRERRCRAELQRFAPRRDWRYPVTVYTAGPLTEPSQELADLAFFALDHAVESVKVSGGPLIPFAATEDESGRTLNRFVTELLEEGQQQARDYVGGATDAHRVAIAYDGYLTIEGERFDAVLVEAQQRGDASGLILAQRYRTGGRFRKFSTIGNPAHIGEASLF